MPLTEVSFGLGGQVIALTEKKGEQLIEYEEFITWYKKTR